MVKIKMAKASANKDIGTTTIERDKDSQRVCVFLSVLMASLFITNGGDIISELVGVLQQSSISAALKVFCALTFIYCLPAILKHMTKVKIIFVFASILVVLLNILLFNISQFTDTIITFYTMCALSETPNP